MWRRCSNAKISATSGIRISRIVFRAILHVNFSLSLWKFCVWSVFGCWSSIFFVAFVVVLRRLLLRVVVVSFRSIQAFFVALHFFCLWDLNISRSRSLTLKWLGIITLLDRLVLRRLLAYWVIWVSLIIIFVYGVISVIRLLTLYVWVWYVSIYMEMPCVLLLAVHLVHHTCSESVRFTMTCQGIPHASSTFT